jgi:hypothetical protein
MIDANYTEAMFRRRRAAIAAVLAIGATAVVTAGCGSAGTGSPLQLDPVSAAVTKTQDAGAAHVSLNIVLRGHGRVVRLHGTGAIDGTSAEMSFKLGSLLGQAGIPASAVPSGIGAKLGHGSLKEVALEQDGDYVVYLRLGFLSSQLPGGVQWIKLDVTKLGKSAGLDLSSLMSGSELQPADLLSMLEAEGATVQKVGPATIDGVATTQYHVTIDTAKALQSSGLTAPLLSQLAAKMKTVSENVWIDKDGLVRRVASGFSSPAGPRAAMTMDISDYGAHVTIAAPPSSQVFDATQLAQQGLARALH